MSMNEYEAVMEW